MKTLATILYAFAIVHISDVLLDPPHNELFFGITELLAAIGITIYLNRKKKEEPKL